jgi:hypothetical protein
MTVPSRVTPAELALGIGEEFRLDVAGEIEADSTFASGPVGASIGGTVGYSDCAGGNSEAPCPFYLGSLELELAEPLVIELECNSVPQTYELAELTIRLGQPAFGVAEEGTDWKGFPPGSLILEAEGTVNEIPFASRRPNREAIYVYGGAGWIQLAGIDGAWVELEVPCGEEQADLLVWLGFEAVDWPGEPPTISIDVPSTVSCPDEIDLDHTKWTRRTTLRASAGSSTASSWTSR